MLTLGRHGSSRGRKGEGTMDTRTMNRRGLMRAASGFIIAAGLALACTDSSGPTGTGTKLPNSPFLVSSPVPDPSQFSSSGAGALSGTVGYVSLPPGAFPDGVNANIRDLRTGISVTA